MTATRWSDLCFAPCELRGSPWPSVVIPPDFAHCTTVPCPAVPPPAVKLCPPVRLAAINHHIAASRYAECVQALLPIARDFPQDIRVLNWLAIGLFLQKKPEQARFYAQRAVDIDPAQPNARLTLAHACFALRDFDAAHAHYQKTWDTGLQNFKVAHAHLGCLRDAHRWADAARIGKVYAAHHTINFHPAVVTVVAEALGFLGRNDEALLQLAQCMSLADSGRFGPIPPSESVPIMACRATLLNYAGATPATIRAAHDAHTAVLPSEQPLPPRAPRDLLAPLRVGLVSGDLRTHSCAWFVRPLLSAIDPARVALFCYSTTSHPDAITDELRALVPSNQWRDFPPALSDDALHAQILADRIDVLVDCSGLTTHNRLSVFARRAAPMQLSWLGYPFDTRIPAISARIVDHFTDPPADTDPIDEPRLLRITRSQDPTAPRFLCYAPPQDAPTPREPAARPAGPFTFCCFNALQKHTPALYRAWASILEGAPNARLILKARGTDVAQVREDVLERLAAANVPLDRVEVLAAAPSTNHHLVAYQRCDLQLDTFPYAGTTTTFESLFMGVPVLTLAAHHHAGRVGATILTAVQHDELIVNDIDSYIAKAIALATNPAQLAPHAENLRARLLASPLCNARAFADAFTSTIERAVQA